MAIITKTDWKPTSVPTAEDFKRIENNIAELDNNKEPKISVLPIDKGGTGSITVESARGSLGLGYTRGPVPINCGGTGATTVATARANLGLGNTTGPVPVSCGGTGATTIAEARKKLGLGDTTGPVPIECGGTGSTYKAGARENLGISEKTMYFKCYRLKKSAYRGAADETGASVAFKGICVGNIFICSAYIGFNVSADQWIRIDVNQYVISAVATAYKSDLENFTPGCVVCLESQRVFIGCDENSGKGFTVLLTLQM